MNRLISILKKNKKLVLVSFIVFLFFTFKFWFSDLKYIEQVTGIDFPYGTETIEVYNNYEFAMVGKFKLSEAKIEDFFTNNDFKKVSNNSTFYLSFSEMLSEPNRPNLSTDKPYFYWNDCAHGKHWNVLFAKELGELWIALTFPDMSGDSAPCKEK